MNQGNVGGFAIPMGRRHPFTHSSGQLIMMDAIDSRTTIGARPIVMPLKAGNYRGNTYVFQIRELSVAVLQFVPIRSS